MGAARTWFAVVSFVIISVSPSLGGELEPAGSPAPTPGPEPRVAVNAVNTPGDTNAMFTISEPGSYYLAENIVADSAINGIIITASEVTLDLNGFALRTTAVIPGQEPLTAIRASGGFLHDITIRNGNIRGWSESGINLVSSIGTIIEGVNSSHNGGAGIETGISGVVRQCTSTDNGEDGFRTLSGCTVTECTAHDNGDNGFEVGQATLVSNCVAYQNDGIGFLSVTNNANFEQCFSSFNGESGIAVGGGSVIRCTSMSNGENGITSNVALILDCRVLNNATGIKVQTSCRVDGNTISNNTVGIEATLSGNLIVRNSATGGSQNHYGAIVSGNDVGTVRTTPVGAGPWDNFSP